MKQTAGHDALGEFAPEFAHLNDDVLFGEVWSREDKLSLKLRSIATADSPGFLCWLAKCLGRLQSGQRSLCRGLKGSCQCSRWDVRDWSAK